MMNRAEQNWPNENVYEIPRKDSETLEEWVLRVMASESRMEMELR